jgi:hypothetical protein
MNDAVYDANTTDILVDRLPRLFTYLLNIGRGFCLFINLSFLVIQNA